jgi:hypothetical protein
MSQNRVLTQILKPADYEVFSGTAKVHPCDEDLSLGTPEAVPFQNRFMQPGSSEFGRAGFDRGFARFAQAGRGAWRLVAA